MMNQPDGIQHETYPLPDSLEWKLDEFIPTFSVSGGERFVSPDSLRKILLAFDVLRVDRLPRRRNENAPVVAKRLGGPLDMGRKRQTQQAKISH
jgi:hypothetical protein